MHLDDVRWVIVALRQMYDCNSDYGESCYRLLSRNGRFIYLHTKGFLEIDRGTNKVHSFLCVNTLLDEEAGRQKVQEMKEKFSTIIKAEMPTQSTTPDLPASQAPQQLERIVLYLIENLHKSVDTGDAVGGQPMESLMDDGYCSPANTLTLEELAPSPTPTLALVPPAPSSVKSSISKSVSVVNVTAARKFQQEHQKMRDRDRDRELASASGSDMDEEEMETEEQRLQEQQQQEQQDEEDEDEEHPYNRRTPSPRSIAHLAAIDERLRTDRRCFTVRLARASTRAEATRHYERVRIDGCFRRSDSSLTGGAAANYPIVSQLIRRSRNNNMLAAAAAVAAEAATVPPQHDAIAQAALHGISGNDIVLVAMARVLPEERAPEETESPLGLTIYRQPEPYQLEYHTRHLIDGSISPQRLLADRRSCCQLSHCLPVDTTLEKQ